MSMPPGNDGSSAQPGGSAAATDPTGCCTIMAPAQADREYPHLTEAQCAALAETIPRATYQWVQGECAQ
jgi:hypothetical protein